MTLNQLTKAVLGKVAFDHGMGRTATRASIVHTFQTILTAVQKGAVVDIPDFGVFRLHVVRPRWVKLPNGQAAHVNKRTELWFRPTVNVKEAPREEKAEDVGRSTGGRQPRPGKAPQAAPRDRRRRK